MQHTHSLDLVTDQEDAMLPAERLDLFEVVIVRDDDAARDCAQTDIRRSATLQTRTNACEPRKEVP